MLTYRLRLGVLAGLALSAAVLSAQAPAPAAPAPAPAPGGQGTQPTFRVNIDLVTMDAIVRNGQDQFVADLTKDDFQVLEDGVAQAIVVHAGARRPRAQPPGAAAAAD